MFFFWRTLRSKEIILKLRRKTKADSKTDWPAAHQFLMFSPEGERVGECELRFGSEQEVYYCGHIGYSVYPAHRGNHYAEKATRLLFTLARQKGMQSLIITCDPDNLPSRKTCEALGGELLEIAELPQENIMREAGSTHKCIFRYDLTKKSTRGERMDYRSATLQDIEGIVRLQERYHVSTISQEDRPHGFVTTLFTPEQFASLIEEENGISLALDGEEIVGYAMAASWDYWAPWPLFSQMIRDLPKSEYLGQVLSTENSYQYGPICIHTDYRGSEVLPRLFDFSREQMAGRFPILITFINHINPRSYEAHTRKLGLDVLKNFVFNDNNYYLLAYDTSVKVKGL